jgi:glycosyltransferase involved in cell wall biosynthesis
VTLVFAALNRQDDWAPIMPALNEVLVRFGPRVRVKVIFDRRFFDALATDRKEFQPLCPYDRYLEILRSAEVGLLPLEPTEMNVAKSDLKFIESAACGLAVLASPTVYQDSIQDGRTGLIYRSPGEFRQKLTALIESPELRRQIAGQAYQHVRDQRQLSRHFRQRYDWYLALRDSLPRLNAELAARVPELTGVLRQLRAIP